VKGVAVQSKVHRLFAGLPTGCGTVDAEAQTWPSEVLVKYGLGVDLGTTYTAAAVYVEGSVETVQLGTKRAEMPSAVYLTEDGAVLVGEAAERRGAADPGRLAREFKRRIGDPVPVLLGGTPYSAHLLTARVLEQIVRVVTSQQEGPPAAITVTHPANWGPYKRELLEQAVRLADVTAELCPEPYAAAIQYAAGQRVGVDEIVAVYDLGGGTFDAAVLRKTTGGFQLLGQSEGIEQLGGVDFDEAVLGHVMSTLAEPLERLDPDDDDVTAALSRLRRDCVDAKEALSYDTEVLIPVALPNLHTRIRLNRSEFEAMIAPALTDTVAAMRRALRSAGVEPEHLRAILLAGGSSRIPLVGQLVAAEFDRPTVLDANPEHSIALGAARTANPAGESGLDAAPVTANGRVAAQQPAAPPPVVAGNPPTPAIGAPQTGTGPVAGNPPTPAIGAPQTRTGPVAGKPPTPAIGAPPARTGPEGGKPGGSTVPRRKRVLLVLPVALIAAVVLAVVAWTGRDRPAGSPVTAGDQAITAPPVTAVSPTPVCGFADEFAGNAVDSRWDAVREGGFAVSGGAMELTARDGADIYEQHVQAPMLLQRPTGDFTLETDVTARPRQMYQGAGLVLWSDPQHYVRLERGSGDVGAIVFEYKNGGPHTRVHPPFSRSPDVVRTDDDRVVLQLSKTADTVHARWRPFGAAGWRELGSIAVAMPRSTKAGVAALNRAQSGAVPKPFGARFEYVRVSC
jgi:actin-like ATPase involved in cell morphogenesis